MFLRAADRAVSVTLYRAIRRLAVAYDADPVLRSLLSLPGPPPRVYSHEDQAWVPNPVVQGSRRAFLSATVRDYLDGEGYRPGSGPTMLTAAWLGA